MLRRDERSTSTCNVETPREQRCLRYERVTTLQRCLTPGPVWRRSVVDLVCELAGDDVRVLLVARDHEAGVVARQSADDTRMLGAVDRTSDRRRRSKLRVHDDEVLRHGRPARELGQHRPESSLRIVAPPALIRRQLVPGPAERVVRLLEPELADVTGNRGL